MELSRRDAVGALAAIGVGAGAAGYALDDSGEGSEPPEERPAPDVETLVAVAEVVYPSEVSGIAEFVEAYAERRVADDDHARGTRAAIEELDLYATELYDAPFAELSADDRDSLLREMGADTAAEDPAGTDAERVRYYLVNDLLLALYASPTGGELVGIENPQGHPGGTESYRRGP